MEAFETFLPSSTRISCSLPSSLDFPKAPLGRPSSFPWAFAAASSSLVRSEIRSRPTSANNPNRAIMTLVCRSCWPSNSIPSLIAMEADIAMDQSVHDLDHLPQAASQTRQLADQQAIAHLKPSQHLVRGLLKVEQLHAFSAGRLLWPPRPDQRL